MKLLMDWQGAYKGIRVQKNLDVLDRYPSKCGDFRITSYICPDCGEPLYKARARDGAVTDFDRYVDLPIFNMFVCYSCHRFFVSLRNNSGEGKLSDLALVSKRYSKREEFQKKDNDVWQMINPFSFF